MTSGNYVLAAVLIIASYFIGNLSPSTILAKASGHDIKKEGSGNAGATNVLRVVGPKAAAITLIIDVLKGFIPVKLSYYIMCNALGCSLGNSLTVAAWAGLAVFLGHVWPVLLKFQGGKGVATALGVILAFDIKSALICLGVFIVVVALTKMVSLGSMIAAAIFPFVFVLLFVLGNGGDAPIVIDYFSVTILSIILGPMVIPLVLMAGILIFKHRANIGRIIRGEENKLSFKKHE